MTIKSVAEWMAERGLTLTQLAEVARLDDRIVAAIAAARYTPSPEQRQRVAAALGVTVEEVTWSHQAAVVHVQGHGPQFGRSP